MESQSHPRLTSSVNEAIRELIEASDGSHNADLVHDIVRQGLKLLNDVEHRGDVRVIQTAIRELRYAFKLFAPYGDNRKVTIFGSARTKPEKKEYQQCVEFARKIADAGFMVITGAGPGIMQAGHEGAGVENSFGANIRLPWEQGANPVIAEDKKLVTFKYFFTRKLTFIRHSDAVVLFPGGFGTMDEAYETLTLIQTGKSQMMPLVLVDKPGGTYWKNWNNHVKDHLLRDKLISPEDLNLFHVTDDVDEAVKIVARFYRNYHSSRFVGDNLVIRVKNAPSDTAVEALNEDFADIIEGDEFHVRDAYKEEQDDNDAPGRARLVFGFDRRGYGRLRTLIDVLNSF
ncbi:MAG: TIGR00730 family Rossman fold protein [Verrucomicrobiales bacterium]|nr:TIGR00730 family Rossman fold protein [Verrucomicrobiales bacterium]